MPDHGEPEHLPLRAALDLAHVLTARVADEAAVDLLVIKGASAVAEGMRPPTHTGCDVDLLVRPDHAGRLIDALSRRGWRARPVAFRTPRVLPPLAATMINPPWPCDIDVHLYYPGFLAEPAAAFETLWRSRQVITVAGVSLPAPGRAATILVHLLNALRAEDDAAASDRCQTLTSLLEDPDQLAEVLEVARGTGSESIVRVALGDPCDETRLRRPATGRANLAAPTRWDLFVIDPSSGLVAGLHALRSGTVRQRLSTLARLIWKPGPDLNADRPQPGGPWSTVRGNVSRWRRAAPSLARAVRVVRSVPSQLPSDGLVTVEAALDQLLRGTPSAATPTLGRRAPAPPPPRMDETSLDPGVVITISQGWRVVRSGDRVYALDVDGPASTILALSDAACAVVGGLELGSSLRGVVEHLATDDDDATTLEPLVRPVLDQLARAGVLNVGYPDEVVLPCQV